MVISYVNVLSLRNEKRLSRARINLAEDKPSERDVPLGYVRYRKYLDPLDDNPFLKHNSASWNQLFLNLLQFITVQRKSAYCDV
jgi:hypothetical protein